MGYWLKTVRGASLVLLAALWLLSRPQTDVVPANLAEVQGSRERGERIFLIGGCASCHRPPDADATSALDLSGGRRFETAFGTFVAPNITPHEATGIGSWSNADFVTAMLTGVSPQGEHYYPVFPYTSYARMRLQDVVDLKTFLDTLPAVDRENPAHEVAFPFNLRRGLGLWKRVYGRRGPVTDLDSPTPQQRLGQYLVEGPGHCGECHTPRTFGGGLDYARWLAGAPSPDGDGVIPNITPHPQGLGEWQAVDIAGYLASGFTPDYDVVGGAMAEVVDNLAQVSEADREAIAAYLRRVEPSATAYDSE
ncbi:cytochrome c [Motiliproteus sp. SC1-56]|uniref:c-type cytochrome n=1 Tax=Motiliproteus sp. SC1-56 TaxID=2799565 RepID=UPI001A901D30|nr:cytochrome c [Motiliproteus sp. SC1-56]